MPWVFFDYDSKLSRKREKNERPEEIFFPFFIAAFFVLSPPVQNILSSEIFSSSLFRFLGPLRFITALLTYYIFAQ